MAKNMFLWLCPAILAAGLISTPVLAQDRERAGLDDRLNRLERRITEMAERQEKVIQHRPGGNPVVAPCAACPLLPPQSKVAPPPMGPKCPLRCCPWLLVGLLALAATVNILLAVWIFTDIRKRGDGHGVFVALALVAGIPTAIIYALVRIGDRKS